MYLGYLANPPWSTRSKANYTKNYRKSYFRIISKMAATSPTLEVKNSLEIVINSVRDSFLNYSMQETPYSLYFTIRKSFSRASQASLESSPQFTQHQADSEIKALKTKVTCLEEKNFALTNQYEEALNDCQVSYLKIKDLESSTSDLKEKFLEKCSDVQKKDKIVEQMIVSKDNLARDLEVAEKNWKELNRSIKAKDKELHELNKENLKITEKFEKVQADFKNLTAIVNKDKKSEAKKLRKVERKEFMDDLIEKPEEFSCSKCAVKVESLVNLKIHETSVHAANAFTQTTIKDIDDKIVQTLNSEFPLDKCIQMNNESKATMEWFYCEKDIGGEEQLLEHRVTCHGAAESPSLFSFPIRPMALLFKCVICGLVKGCEEDIINHKKSVHGNQ